MHLRPVVLVAVLLALIAADGARARTPEGDAQVHFFETKVRPVLAEHCYSCHSGRAKKLKANLLVDGRASLLKGGDNGPAIVPGEPDKSRLIDAIRYQNVDLQMPPKKKLSDAQIADLTEWVKLGAYWPSEAGRPAEAVAGDAAFNLQQRKASHWAWQPVRVTPPPAVKRAEWVRSPVDSFVLAKLEAKGLAPAPPAERHALLRRVYFDLIGLPPSPEEVDAFLQDTSPEAFEKVVDRLLASPHFGERWGRHWLDLVRYGQTYGHEFDYPIPHARQYLDYVIRAFNADVPYDQFVREQIAGDLLPEPRLHPTEKFNESVIGSGFWHLGEQVHGPVDVRQHQADRIDNQVDVFGKALLGLTIACARCHDHKFDAISTKDYYALFGVLQSSRLQQAYLDPHSRISQTVGRMKALLAEANRLLAPTSKDQLETTLLPTPFEEFAASDYSGWFASGWAFGDAPTRAGQWDSLTRVASLARPAVAHSGILSPRLRGVLRSRSFIVPDGSIHYRLAGTGPGVHVRLIIDGYTMDAFNSVLFEGISFPVETGGNFKWHRQDVRMYKGHRAHLELIDDGDGWLAVDEIRFSDPVTPFAEPPTPPTPPLAASHEVVAELQRLAQRLEAEERTLIEPTRALAMTDGDGADAQVFVRGSHKNPGEVVPRRFLEALAGSEQSSAPSGSGRLELARRVADPSNPLTARVMANRVWHHLFGRGIVPTVDDFGVMGQPPTHPELLDHLADAFVKEGWSLKRLVRSIVLTSAYRMASRPSDETVAAQLDPQNTLLHHMPVRRLEAEAIRDAILAVSGRLDRTVHAPTAEVHLTPFMEGRGRPKESGPLDGNGVRSVYVAVRRNFLPPMMLAFDYPVPFNTIGRRGVSNVPAQALILMNDPFVVEQARRWAETELTAAGLSPRQRVERMYVRAFARPPTAQEADEALAFLHQQGDALGLSAEARVNDRRVWTDLAHVLFNVKEFIFIN